MTSSTVYLTVAAKRIQPWLARTPRLALLRGASKALRDETNPKPLEEELRPRFDRLGAVVQHRESAVDGLVVVTVPEPRAPDAARILLDRLSRRLPGVEWSAWWGPGASYVEAYAARTVTDDSVLPALMDVPVAKTCAGCRQEPGTTVQQLPGDDTSPGGTLIGPDCSTRWSAQREEVSRAQGSRDATPEASAPPSRPRDARDFDELARKGGPRRTGEAAAVGRKDSRNHLATICADGNRVGSFFDEIAWAGPDYAGYRSCAIDLLNTQLVSAVSDSIDTLSDGARVSVAIAHYVGGDDVLLSVPASRAWEMSHHLMTGFDGLKTSLTDALPSPGAGATEERRATHQRIEEAIGGMSLGVGVVFAHATHPFSDTQRLAHEAMTQAKRRTRGQESAVGWVDLTEGTHPDSRHTLCGPDLKTLMERSAGGEPQGVLKVNPSGRARLANLAMAYPDTETLTRAVTVWLRRAERDSSLSVQPPRDPVTLKDLQPIDDLPRGLSLARWWPTHPVLPSSQTAAATPGQEEAS